jgi:hypothetical protein
VPAVKLPADLGERHQAAQKEQLDDARLRLSKAEMAKQRHERDRNAVQNEVRVTKSTLVTLRDELQRVSSSLEQLHDEKAKAVEQFQVSVRFSRWMWKEITGSPTTSTNRSPPVFPHLPRLTCIHPCGKQPPCVLSCVAWRCTITQTIAPRFEQLNAQLELSYDDVGARPADRQQVCQLHVNTWTQNKHTNTQTHKQTAGLVGACVASLSASKNPIATCLWLQEVLRLRGIHVENRDLVLELEDELMEVQQQNEQLRRKVQSIEQELVMPA